MRRAAPVVATCWCTAALGLLGCGHSGPTQAKSPPVIYASPTVITPRDETAAEKFEQARGLLSAGRNPEAARLFDEVAAFGPAEPLAPLALFNAAIAWEAATDRASALARFQS